MFSANLNKDSLGKKQERLVFWLSIFLYLSHLIFPLQAQGQWKPPRKTGINSFPSPAHSAESDFPGVVKILVRDRDPHDVGKISAGSGFFIEKSGVLVTAFHVIDSIKSIEDIRFIDGPKAGVTFENSTPFTSIIALDPIRDIAVLKAEGHKPKKIYPVKEINEKRLSSEKVIISGFQAHRADTVETFRGEINNLQDGGDYFATVRFLGDLEELQKSSFGLSGSPVVLENGDLVGALSRRLVKELSISKNVHKALESNPLSCVSDECIKEAFKKLWEKGMEGDRDAQFFLAETVKHERDIYKYHFGTNAPSYCEWYHKAAAQGLTLALYYSSRCLYEAGRVDEAVALLKRACSENLNTACGMLEQMFGIIIQPAIRER